MAAKNEVLRNMNLIVDGSSYAGTINEVVPPKLVVKTEEARFGGMDAPIDMDMGMEKLMMEYNIASYDAQIYKGFGLKVGANIQHTLKGATEDRDGVVNTDVIHAHGKVVEVDEGTWKAGQQVQLKAKVSLVYYRRERNGEELCEIDVENNKRVIGGVDQLEAINNAIGI